MFRETVTVAAPTAAAQTRLVARLALDQLQSEAVSSHGEAAEILMRAGFGPVSKQVKVRALPPFTRNKTIVIPIRWEATSAAGSLFPALDANIELSPRTDDHGRPATEIAVLGSYRPPLGALGAVVDHVVLRQAALATIRSFLRDLAAVVQPDATCDPAPAIDPPVAEGLEAD